MYERMQQTKCMNLKTSFLTFSYFKCPVAVCPLDAIVTVSIGCYFIVVDIGA